MPATLITRWRSISPTGIGVELVVWRLPEPLPPTTHGYKYRLVYVVDGKRVIGFDNQSDTGGAARAIIATSETGNCHTGSRPSTG